MPLPAVARCDSMVLTSSDDSIPDLPAAPAVATETGALSVPAAAARTEYHLAWLSAAAAA